jgi:sorting nexin-4
MNNSELRHNLTLCIIDLQNDYTNFATSIQGLSSLETNITHSLHQFAEASKAYSKAMKEMIEVEEIRFLNEIHELLAYCYAAKVNKFLLSNYVCNFLG